MCEFCVNIGSKVVAFPIELLHAAYPSENLPDSSSISIENDLQVLIQMNKIVQRVNEKIDGLPPLLPEPCIFKVHEGLRSVNEKAYTPLLISIGPYHHGNSNLRAMEEHKLRYFQSFYRRINNTNNNGTIPLEYLLLVEKMADRAQACYADPICLERDKFVEMIFLDACFIIEFLRKCLFEELRDKDDPIFRTSWMQTQIFRDLMLLENQLPFFILSELFDKTHVPCVNYVSLPVLAMFFISQMLPKNYSIEKHVKQINERGANEIKHFLDLVHSFYLPTSQKDSDSSGHKRCSRMPSVTELQDVGISFKVDDSDDVSIFDIRFKNGEMKIPKFKVADQTETFLRNIVAYEQHSSVKPQYFTDYRSFMNSLINSEKDVNVLRLHGIIDNMLGDDEEVARIFNKLGDGVITDPSTFYYWHVYQKVKHHCKKPWNQAMAKLRRNYFNNPWASISTVAAAVLLSLTLIQTVVALTSLFT